jgi:DNA-directed RNA polymerase sigma subunit (sigma70/sigma32)
LSEKSHEQIQQFINEHLDLLEKIAQFFVGRGVDHDDLILEGSVGLIRAAERCQSTDPIEARQQAAAMIKLAMEQAIMEANGQRVPGVIYEVPRYMFAGRSDSNPQESVSRKPISKDDEKR